VRGRIFEQLVFQNWQRSQQFREIAAHRFAVGWSVVVSKKSGKVRRKPFDEILRRKHPQREQSRQWQNQLFMRIRRLKKANAAYSLTRTLDPLTGFVLDGD
jgi:hypothetical protein